MKRTKEMYKECWSLAWPAIMELSFIQLAGMVDSLMVSSMGPAAVAAIGLTGQPIMIRLAPFTAINTAMAALVARRKGEGRRDGANRLLLTGIYLCIALSVVIAVVYYFAADWIIAFSGSNADTHGMAVQYFKVCSVCTVFTVLQNVINAAQRSAGNTKIALRTHIVSNIINVIMNYLLIGGNLGFPKLGVLGAVIATVSGQGVAMVLSFLSLLKKESYLSFHFIAKNKIRATWAAVRNICKVGVSAFVEQLLLRVGFFLTSKMAAKQGTVPFAVHQVALNNLYAFAGNIFGGIQTAVVALCGRSLGRGKPEEAKAHLSVFTRYSILFGILCTLIFLFGGRFLFGLYFDEKEALLLGDGLRYFIILGTLVDVIFYVYSGCLHAAGDMIYVSAVETVATVVIRPLIAYLLTEVIPMGISGIWIALVTEHGLRAICFYFRVKGGKWMQIKI